MFSNARKKTSITLEYRSITPKQAQDVLDHTASNSFPQRQLSPGTVENYASEMRNGTWHPGTADVVRLTDYNGAQAVLDGQHRLAAISKSGLPQDMWVATGVPEEAFKYIDQGKPRTLNHVMHSAGWPSATVLSATGRFLMMHKTGGVGLFNKGSHTAPGTMFDAIKRDFPDMKSLWETYGKVITKAARRCGIPVQAAYLLFYLAEKTNHDEAVSLFIFLADSYASEPKDKIFRLMIGRMDENVAEFQKAKDLGREVRTEVRMADQFQVMRFSWLCHTGQLSAKPKTLLGFNKSHNKWANNGGSAAPWAL